MRYNQLKEKLNNFVLFSLQDIRKQEPSFDRRRLNEWQAKGYIKKVRRGFYVFTDLDLDEESLFLIANRIYEPSYVSLETALSFYNLIPEGVYSITSVSTIKTASFGSSVGHFNYRKIKPELFFGYSLKAYQGHHYKIAEAEKAVLDYLYLHPEMSDSPNFSEWRLNRAEFLSLADMSKLSKYLSLFNSKALDKRVGRFLKFIGEKNVKS